MEKLSPAILEVAEAQEQLRGALSKRVRADKEVESARHRLRLANDAAREEHYELMAQSA